MGGSASQSRPVAFSGGWRGMCDGGCGAGIASGVAVMGKVGKLLDIIFAGALAAVLLVTGTYLSMTKDQ